MAKRSRVTSADIKSVSQHQQAMRALNPAQPLPSNPRFFRKASPSSTVKGLPLIEQVADKFGYVKKPW